MGLGFFTKTNPVNRSDKQKPLVHQLKQRAGKASIYRKEANRIAPRGLIVVLAVANIQESETVVRSIEVSSSDANPYVSFRVPN